MDVEEWLRDLGLPQYASAFRDNDIEAGVLLRLTAEDLHDIGVGSVGHRRKLLDAIAALRDGPPAHRSDDVHERPPSASPPPTSPADAERRQLTVMFVDLVGSTALSARLDPEEMSEIIRGYQDCCAGEIIRFEGYVAKFMGDGVLAYFGWPHAHEHDAERAIRAGLAISAAVAQRRAPSGRPLAARIGIATGLVVVGELVGDEEARERAVVGETPSLAARLQESAPPGSVIVADRTRRLLGDLFEFESLGQQALKGFEVPVEAFVVTGEGHAESRFEAFHAGALTPVVGREQELALLLERWERAVEGEGQVVLLSGEPGIGKSRIVRALRERLSIDAYTPLGNYCSPYHANTAFHPVIGLLERAAGFERDDTAEEKLAKLEALLAQGARQDREAVALLASLLAIPPDRGGALLDLPPQRIKQRTLDILVEQLAGLAARKPVLTIYEDVHWIDPSTLELLGLVIERIQRLPVLVLITFRPEFSPPWTSYAHVTQLSLSRLTRRHCASVAHRVTGGKALPPEILDQIVARTDGVPLFIEELTKAVMESDLLRDAGNRFELAGPLPPLGIPATLHESLMARLDHLAPVKEVAQIGAAIGRQFSHVLVAAVSRLNEPELRDTLEQLCASELVYRRGVPPDAIYSFKHALVQEAAYATLVRAKRQRLHAGIAEALVRHFPQIEQTEPELLAHHLAEAGRPEQAIAYRLRAGERAIARSALTEALAQLQSGLALLAMLPETNGRLHREMDLQIALSVALMAERGWAAPEAGRANARARELCERIGATARLWPVLYGQWAFHAVRAEHEAARELAEEFLRRAEQDPDPSASIVAHRIVGTGALLRGEPAAAYPHLERTLALYDPARHRSLGFLYVQDPKVAALSSLSWTLFLSGDLEGARSRSEEALAVARGLHHRNTLGYALLYGCILSQMQSDLPQARERADGLIALAREQASPHFLGAGMVVRGWTVGAAGDTKSGVAEIRDGLASWQVTGASFLMPFFLGLLAEVGARAGAAAGDGPNLLDEALVRVERTGERWFEAELGRLAGELMLQRPKPDFAAAERRFLNAAATARRQGCKLWELRVATSLARLWIGRGRQEEAADLLAPVCATLPDGLSATQELHAARKLLDHAARPA